MSYGSELTSVQQVRQLQTEKLSDQQRFHGCIGTRIVVHHEDSSGGILVVAITSISATVSAEGKEFISEVCHGDVVHFTGGNLVASPNMKPEKRARPLIVVSSEAPPNGV